MWTVSSSQFRRAPLLAVVALGACATVPGLLEQPAPAARARFSSVAEAWNAVADGTALSDAPRVRLVLPGGSSALDSRYVQSSVRLSERGYAMVVAVDLDRRVRVIYPESPDESGYIAQTDARPLDRFFSGFGPVSQIGISLAGNPRGFGVGGRGMMIAIASDRPFQFDRLAGDDGEWDEYRIARLVFQPDPTNSARTLGNALTLAGQDFTIDHSSFGGSRFGRFDAFSAGSFDGLGCGGTYLSEYSGYYGNPDAYADRGSGYGLPGRAAPLVRYRTVNGIVYVSYLNEGGCGRVYYTEWTPVGAAATPPVVPDTSKKPSTTPLTLRIVDERATGRIPASALDRETGIRVRPPELVDDRPERRSVNRVRDASEPAGATGRNAAQDRPVRQEAVQDQQERAQLRARQQEQQQQEKQQQQQQQQQQAKAPPPAAPVHTPAAPVDRPRPVKDPTPPR